MLMAILVFRPGITGAARSRNGTPIKYFYTTALTFDNPLVHPTGFGVENHRERKMNGEWTGRLAARGSATGGKTVFEGQPGREARQPHGANQKDGEESHDQRQHRLAHLAFDKSGDQTVMTGLIAVVMQRMMQGRRSRQCEESQQLQDKESGQDCFCSPAKKLPAFPRKSHSGHKKCQIPANPASTEKHGSPAITQPAH